MIPFRPIPLNPELAALLEKVKKHEMTPEERRAQRISFVYGMLPDGDTRSKEDVARWLAKHDGYDDLHAEITKLKSELEEARAAIREYLDEFDAPVKDYALRTVLRNKLRALNGSAK